MGLEITLCDLNSMKSEAQTREVESREGIGEEHFQKKSSCTVFGNTGLAFPQANSISSQSKNFATVRKVVEQNDKKWKRGGSQGSYHWNLFQFSSVQLLSRV